MPINLTRRKHLQVASVAALAGCTGCTIGSGGNHDGKDAPRSADVSARLKTSKPLALVLSSGGPRGFVHVGVIQALDEIGVRPDMVVGASIGALIGTLYCGGMTGKALRELAMDLGPLQFASLAIGTKERFSGAPIATRINIEIDHRELQALRPVCGVVARNKSSGQAEVFTEGNAGIAVQASTAIQGRFTPVSIRSIVYDDADPVTPMPVRISREMGADRVISIDASAHEDKAPSGAARFYESDRRKRALTAPDAKSADLNLHPEFGYWVSLSKEFRERAMNAGYAHTMRRAKKIEALGSR
jgi:NTE family protein